MARIALAATALVLFGLGVRSRGGSILDRPIWDLQHSSNLKALLLSVGVAWAITFLAYAVVGFLAVQSLSTQRENSVLPRYPMSRALLIGIGLSAIVSTAAAGPGLHWPNPIDLLLPAFGCLFGAWIGKNWLAGGRVRKSIVPKIMLIGTSGFAALIAFAILATESMPLNIEPAEVASVDRVRLTGLIHSKSPRVIPDGETVTLSLTEQDVNILLAWGLSLGSSDRVARVETGHGFAKLRSSIRLPAGNRMPKYLNLTAAGVILVDDGVLHLRLRELRIGRLSMPYPLLWLFSGGLAKKIQLEPLVVPILAEIRSAGISGGSVSATYRRIDMPAGFRDDIFGSIGPDEQVHAALAAQFEQIARLNQIDATPQLGFDSVLRSAFRLAYDRSHDRDPVVENRAAIIALGITFGHDFVSEFAGAIPHEKIPRISTFVMRQMRLRGRSDWSRHFFVSAALEVISTESVSHDVGVLKEELDAGTDGGSGFSFADLLADRSGTLLANIATRDKDSARIIQRRLLAEFEIGFVFPNGSDLPENISQRRLQSEYGGVNGERYRQLLHRIDKRIANLGLYEGLLNSSDPGD